MIKLVRRRVLLAKAETVYNTDSVPTGAANAILIEDLNWSPEGLRMVDRPAIRGSLGALQQVYGGSLLSVSFSAEVKGSGAAGTAPELGPLFLGSAMAETIVAATSVTYNPASATQSSLTLYFYEDGTLTKLTGCRGNVDFVGEVGARLMASFTFQGHFSGPTDVALATPTYDTTIPPILINGNFTIGAFGAIIQALNVSSGNTLEVPPNLSSADGYGEVLVTSRDINGSINPEQTLVATKDFMAAFKAGTTEALDTGVLGATAGNRVRIQMPAVYYRSISPSERQGVLAYDLPFGAAEVTGDDEMSISFS
jgi:hypothetical protein